VPLPTVTPEAFRDRYEMLMIHPLVNCGGARHLPTLVAEDVLVEEFPDPTVGERPSPFELFAALRLSSRHGLPRVAIDPAPLTRGANVLEELALDPRVFRLHPSGRPSPARRDREPGRQPFWITSTDTSSWPTGDCAVAGGDVRYGSPYDLLGISRDYAPTA